jgi:hypothetical protein
MKVALYDVKLDEVTELFDFKGEVVEDYIYLVEVQNEKQSYTLLSKISPSMFCFTKTPEQVQGLRDCNIICDAPEYLLALTTDAKLRYNKGLPLAKEALSSILVNKHNVKVLLVNTKEQLHLTKAFSNLELITSLDIEDVVYAEHVHLSAIYEDKDISTTFNEFNTWKIKELFYSSSMYDTKKKEIFTGDILSINGFGMGYVLFHEGRWSVISNESVIPLKESLNKAEIVGDIIHSPALLS